MEGTNDATVPGAAVAEAVAVGLDVSPPAGNQQHGNALANPNQHLGGRPPNAKLFEY